jgi:hypothetical protein
MAEIDEPPSLHFAQHRIPACASALYDKSNGYLYNFMEDKIKKKMCYFCGFNYLISVFVKEKQQKQYFYIDT